MAAILLIEDDPKFQKALHHLLEHKGCEVVVASRGEDGLKQLADALPDVVLLDRVLDKGMTGMQTLKQIHTLYPLLPVIILTGFGTIESAVEAMKYGASDYIQKPVDPDELLISIERTIEVASLRREVSYLRTHQNQTLKQEPIIAASAIMKKVERIATKVARDDRATVLLAGESGTGKDLIASLIHRESPRRHRPFVVFQCGLFAADQVAGELFGWERRSATGATEGRLGYFEMAHGGTLFLDGVGDLCLESQAKLLRILEDGCITRMGSGRQLRVNVRVIASTNRELQKLVDEKSMRPDLYFRLNQVAIRLPLLRERCEDILPLAEFFLLQASRRVGKKFTAISPEAGALLQQYEWPGNVRELYHAIDRVVLLEEGEVVLPEHLTFSFANQPSIESLGQDGLLSEFCTRLDTGNAYATTERLLLMEALKRTKGNTAKAGRWLGLSKSRLAYRLKQHKVRSKDFKERKASKAAPKGGTA